MHLPGFLLFECLVSVVIVQVWVLLYLYKCALKESLPTSYIICQQQPCGREPGVSTWCLVSLQ